MEIAENLRSQAGDFARAHLFSPLPGETRKRREIASIIGIISSGDGIRGKETSGGSSVFGF